MLKFFFISVLFLLSGTSLSYCQNAGVVRGVVKDETKNLLRGVTVALIQAKDSTVSKYSLTEVNGEYEFNGIKSGRYFISINYTGYKKERTVNFEIENNQSVIRLPEIILFRAATELKEVVVNSKKPFIEARGDKTIINVESSISSAGNSVLEILEKSPGVTINDQGNINLRGKDGVNVMIDGKPTYLSSTDLVNILRSMASEEVANIEIITSPSAKYEASGNSGIINIKTKRGKKNGFNGTVNTGFSVSLFKPDRKTFITPRYNNGFTFNYKHNKLNIFGSYIPTIVNSKQEVMFSRTFYDTGGQGVGQSVLNTSVKMSNFNQSLRVGFDLQLNKKNTIGLVLSGLDNENSVKPTSNSQIKDNNNNVSANLSTISNNKIGYKNFAGNFNWKYNFDSTGRELTSDIDYVVYNNSSDLDLRTTVSDQDYNPIGNPIILDGLLPSKINILTFASDYVHPFKKGKFEFGIKSSLVENNNKVDYRRQLPDMSWIADFRSNHFIYRENINAVYFTWSKEVTRKLRVQAGLRLENTIARGEQITIDSVFDRNFTNLFPSFNANYTIDKKQLLTVSYSKRINRPNYQQLNPFTLFLDTLTFIVGNPYLKPEITHNAEVSYILKSKYIFSLSANITQNVIAGILRQNLNERITFNTSENVSRLSNIGFSVTAPAKVTRWLGINFYTLLYYKRYTGIYDGDGLDINRLSFNSNITSNIVLDKKKALSAEIGGFYRHTNVDQLAIFRSNYFITLGLQKQILQNKGTIRLNIRDPFAWQVFKIDTRYSNIAAATIARPDTRVISLNFSYRFGKESVGEPRKKANVSRDEQKRVNVGG